MLFARRRYFEDNYLYLVAEGDDAALVDPGDPLAALELARAHGLRPRFILHTHGHRDHSGGSAQLRAALGAVVYGHPGDSAWFRPDVELADSGALSLGALSLEVRWVPGHTPGSVLYAWRDHLFTGDTLFWGGAGNCKNGGDPARLARSFVDTLSGLDGGLLVEPGHDYAEKNLAFALELEPGNGAARARLEEVRAAGAAGREPDPSRLSQERETNPFLRTDSPALLEALASRQGARPRTAEEAFVALRRMRDSWPGPALAR